MMLVEDVMDAVITQSPQVIVQNAIQIFSNIRSGHAPLSGVPPLTMEIIVKENLP
jgi:LacI family transcriptional regulator